ncbi:MAG TPA: DUF1549 and DUF1553 domain-containing protein, partial [Gemmata sp.]|nr:DUF1549 and DUF1553 domain-containing protein [Gemmata sp.]
LKAVTRTGEHPMPPKTALPAGAVATLSEWVNSGAAYPDDQAIGPKIDASKHWAFRPIQNPPVPTIASPQSPIRNPIDAFILAKLSDNGLSPEPQADRRTLIHRAYFDLIGLPPTAEEVEAFEKDKSPDAWEKVLDRLLASPRYGERWARYWLDIARYADTKGYVFQEDRNFPYAYTYRDYVIRSFNEDKPYDRFITEQLAADRLDLGNDKRPLAAMGFLTLGRRFLNNQQDIIDDRIDVVSRGLMGLTVGCARCHDHKFDPIPTADYYSLYGVFASSTEPKELPLIGEVKQTPAVMAFEKELEKREAGYREEVQKRFTTQMKKLHEPKAIADYIQAGIDAKNLTGRELRGFARDRNLSFYLIERWRDYLATEFEKGSSLFGAAAMVARIHAKGGPLDVPAPDAEKIFNRADRDALVVVRKRIDAFKATNPAAPPRAHVLNDLPRPVEPAILKRGNPNNRGAAVPRQAPAIVSGAHRKPFTNGSGRLELAKVITSPDNPLTARVMVNRVWIGHFGQGFVRTPSDFGTRSDPPTHPELLDWLATRFVQDGWSLKKLHRLIMTSATYQRSSSATTTALQRDPDNRFLAHQNRRRLDFEATRDALIAVSGKLDLAIGGKPVDLFKAPFTTRRSIYGLIDRTSFPGTMRAFDVASPDTHIPQRFVTTTQQQALFLMNSPFVAQQAKALATRAEMHAAETSEGKVKAIYRLALGRDPSREESALAQEFVSDDDPKAAFDRWGQLAQVLLLSNEFEFVD